MASTLERVAIVGTEWQLIELDNALYHDIQNCTNVQIQWSYDNTIENGQFWDPGEILQEKSQSFYVKANTLPNKGYISIVQKDAYEDIFFQRLSDNGKDDGNTNMAVDGSVTPKEFYIQPNDGEIFMLARTMITVQDEKGFDVGTYGGNGLPALANGMQVVIKKDGVERDILKFNIKDTGTIASIAYDLTLHDFGNTDDIIAARWTFTKAGRFIMLNGSKGDFFKIIINDNLSDMTNQYIQVQGYIK